MRNDHKGETTTESGAGNAGLTVIGADPAPAGAGGYVAAVSDRDCNEVARTAVQCTREAAEHVGALTWPDAKSLTVFWTGPGGGVSDMRWIEPRRWIARHLAISPAGGVE